MLALLPIVGIALALNAETVTDYVYEQPQKKVVKKGRKDGQIKVGAKTIEVKTDSQEDPLVIIDGKKSTKAQLEALDTKTIDHVDVLKDKSAVEIYGEEGKNGVIIITTKGKDAEVVVAEVVEPGLEKVFDVVEQMPEFPGGMEALMQFLMENVRYPESASKEGKQGRVLVQFIVESDGSISNAKVVKKVSDDLDSEAIRVVGAMPKWKPGMQKGKHVRVKFTLPITFRLS